MYRPEESPWPVFPLPDVEEEEGKAGMSNHFEPAVEGVDVDVDVLLREVEGGDEMGCSRLVKWRVISEVFRRDVVGVVDEDVDGVDVDPESVLRLRLRLRLPLLLPISPSLSPFSSSSSSSTKRMTSSSAPKCLSLFFCFLFLFSVVCFPVRLRYPAKDASNSASKSTFAADEDDDDGIDVMLLC